MPYEEPRFAPWDGRRVPVTLVGGYLGAGKTTAINELLAATDQPIAIFVNDVGAVNVDARLIKSRSSDTVELTDGCVCCSLSGGIGDAFGQLQNREIPPEHVVIELSGVADPRRVIPWANVAGFRLDGVVILVDAEQFPQQAIDPAISQTVLAQIGEADLALVTKADLVGAEQLAAVEADLRNRLPDIRILSPANAIATGSFLRLGGRHRSSLTEVPEPALFDDHHVETRRIDGPLERSAITQLLADLPDNVLRAKGILEDVTGTRHLIQVVGKRQTMVELPFAEDQPPTDLVIITPRS